jgi:CAAX protease family protein
MKLPKIETSICFSKNQSNSYRYIAQLFALFAIVADLVASSYHCPYWIRLLYAIGIFIVIFYFYRWDTIPLGLTGHLNPDYRYWFKLIGKIAIIIVVWAILGLIVLETGHRPKDMTIHTLNPSRFFGSFLTSCFYAPVVEEIIYRLFFCVVFLPYLKNYGTIIVGGALFAGLHFIYGNPSIENFLGGYVLMWVFLRSGSLILPIIVHLLGNLYVILIQLAAWYILNGKV